MLHESVDVDSIVSNILIKHLLEDLQKKVTLIYSDKIPEQFREIYNLEEVQEKVSLSQFKVSDFDLLFTVDVNDPKRLGINEGLSLPPTINIDHHVNLNYFGSNKINDASYSSTSEMIFFFLEDVGYKINKEEAELVLLGILTDTDSFNYSTSTRVFKTVSKLIELGADFDTANTIAYRNNSLDQMKFWSVALKNTKIDKKGRFAYTTLSLKETSKYRNILQGTRTVADKFIRTLKNTDFGMVMTEDNDNFLKISIRSRRSGFGAIDLLKSFNGGGHFDGGGGKIEGLPFEKAVKRALAITREFVKNRSKNKPTLS